MLHKHVVEIEWAGRPLRLETGRIARQADSAVLAQYGGTSVLATATAAKEAKPGIDFFPLTVNYQEKTFAAGKIPGGYFKREGRPTEKETLTSRLIDRPIRPLFASGFRNETQVVATVLSHDMENDPDIVALIASSAALTLSGIPFLGPIGAARVGYIAGKYVLNPMIDEMRESTLDLVVAGTASAVLMVESEAKELPEDVMLGAVMYGQKHFQPVLDAIVKLAERAAKEPWELKSDASAEELAAKAREIAEAELREAYKIAAKHERRDQRLRDQGEGGHRLGAREHRCHGDRQGGKRLQGAGEGRGPLEHPLHQAPHRWTRPHHGQAHRLRSRHPAAHARQCALHPRRDAGSGGGHARHRRGRAIYRCA